MIIFWPQQNLSYMLVEMMLKILYYLNKGIDFMSLLLFHLSLLLYKTKFLLSKMIKFFQASRLFYYAMHHHFSTSSPPTCLKNSARVRKLSWQRQTTFTFPPLHPLLLSLYWWQRCHPVNRKWITHLPPFHLSLHWRHGSCPHNTKWIIDLPPHHLSLH